MSIDLIDIRAIYSVIMFVLFIGIFLWAWSVKRKDRFHEAAHLPLNEPEFPKSHSDSNNKTTIEETSHE